MKIKNLAFPKKTTSLLVASLLATTAAPAMAADKSTFIGSLRIGALWDDNVNDDGQFAIQNFGSRIRWSGERTINDSLNGVAYVELRIETNDNATGTTGINRTRHARAGLSGDFGSLWWGAGYSTFYDFVTGKADIAWWGSCFVGLECSRETRVLKYTGNFGGFSIGAAIEARADAEEDFIDELELGIGYNIGGLGLGAAVAIYADDTVDADLGLSDDGGSLFGLSAKYDFGAGSIVGIYQLGSDDIGVGGTPDEQTTVSFAGTLGNFYGVLETRDNGAGNDLLSGTLGYTWNIAPSSLMYFEAQTLDNDVPGEDTRTILRATYKFDF